MQKPPSKTDFILDLLQSNQFEVSDKEQLIRLIANEIEALENTNSDVIADVEKIKKDLNRILGKASDHGDHVNNQERKEPKMYHNPQKLVNLLAQFSKDEKVLKYAVHKWDAGAEFDSYSEFMKKLKPAFTKINVDLSKLSKSLSAKCWAFLLNENVSEKGWGFDRVKIGWASPKLASWCKENPLKIPQNYKVPREYSKPKNDVRLVSFKDVINHFKSEIEIREEGDQFKKIIVNIMEERNLNSPNSSFDKPMVINLEQKIFYTDVQWLKSSLERIFDNIIKRTDYKKIKIIAEQEDGWIILKIKHIESYSHGISVNIQNKLTSLSGDFFDIQRNLKNLCDWSIETVFKEGAYRLNYLVSDKEIPFKEEVESCAGFTHILKFYKSNQ